MPPRHDDLVSDPADFAGATPSLQGARRLTAKEQALCQMLDEPKRDPNEIRAIYLLEPLNLDALNEWIASAIEGGEDMP